MLVAIFLYFTYCYSISPIRQLEVKPDGYNLEKIQELQKKLDSDTLNFVSLQGDWSDLLTWKSKNGDSASMSIPEVHLAKKQPYNGMADYYVLRQQGFAIYIFLKLKESKSLTDFRLSKERNFTKHTINCYGRKEKDRVHQSCFKNEFYHHFLEGTQKICAFFCSNQSILPKNAMGEIMTFGIGEHEASKNVLFNLIKKLRENYLGVFSDENYTLFRQFSFFLTYIDLNLDDKDDKENFAKNFELIEKDDDNNINQRKVHARQQFDYQIHNQEKDAIKKKISEVIQNNRDLDLFDLLKKICVVNPENKFSDMFITREIAKLYLVKDRANLALWKRVQNFYNKELISRPYRKNYAYASIWNIEKRTDGCFDFKKCYVSRCKDFPNYFFFLPCLETLAKVNQKPIYFKENEYKCLGEIDSIDVKSSGPQAVRINQKIWVYRREKNEASKLRGAKQDIDIKDGNFAGINDPHMSVMEIHTGSDQDTEVKRLR